MTEPRRDDDDLRRAYKLLRQDDAGQIPPFVTATKSKRPQLRWSIVIGATSLATIVLGGIVLVRAIADEDQGVWVFTEPREPLAFLLERHELVSPDLFAKESAP